MASWKTTLLLLTLFLLSLFLELLLAQATIINSIDGGMNKGCIEVERKALLEFKNGLKDPSGWLSSWVGADCCKWKGVDCNNQTGHVVKVDLKSGGDFSRLGGEISDSLLDLKHLNYLDLSLNDFQGIPIPNFLGSFERLRYLNLSNAAFGGMIPPHLGNLSQLRYLDLNGGPIPHVNLLSLHNLVTLDLSNNNIGSEGIELVNGLSACANSSLEELNLAVNQVSGQLPDSLGLFKNLKSLDLRSIQEQTVWWDSELDVFKIFTYSADIGFSGEIPKWIGERMSSLKQLRLRGNMFTGDIPEQLCWLSHLHILDLAVNNLSGSIPQCLGNLTALSFVTLLHRNFDYPKAHVTYSERMELVVKGQNMEFDNILPIVNLIDLSSNNIWGEIPKEITNLSTLGTLNLSRNQLTGKIPEKIGAMQGLETLDLSCNCLSGPIPPSMSSITSLNHLNLSHNRLSGPIPTTNQFSTFNDPSIYEANLGLYGPPLSTNCSTLNDQDHKDEEEDEDEWDMSWFFISMGLGFPVGFWAVCGSLVLKKSWRQAYFRLIDETRDRLYVFTAVNVARLKRKMEANGVHG
ncbi:putative inactive leucine-rich repeat receptor kinase XIAO [Vitis vinifera]|uniref:Putative inactive leucine-rich repeat receptor kinase XIAO n=1 Tax=Vitis vinifera TaxID=29760 RepID=A0A438IRL7_VITVI|nr:putative inactive leucine-rich repeat receptor kinase XIAO [Vitis vinifera]